MNIAAKLDSEAAGNRAVGSMIRRMQLTAKLQQAEQAQRACAAGVRIQSKPWQYGMSESDRLAGLAVVQAELVEATAAVDAAKAALAALDAAQ